MRKNLFIGLLTGIFLFSCSKEEYDINNLNNTIFVLGHGGLGVGISQYPLDSYESVEKAISMGADGSEIDVQITKDSVLVCYHDTYLEESTNKSGEIYAMNWDEVKDASYKSSPYAVYKIASLEQIFAYSNGTGNLYTFDIKFKNPDQSPEIRDIFQRALIRLIEKYHIEQKISIESPDADFLKSIGEKKSNLKLFYYTDFTKALHTAIEFGFKGITVRADEVTVEDVSLAHASGILVAVFSTTRRNHDDVIKKNVDIIQTDDLEDLIERLK